MKLGIKVGLQKTSIDDLIRTDPACCEVWYNASLADQYEPLFTFLRKRPIDVGLHFWGALADKTWTNLAYPDREIHDKTMRMMKMTIDTASRNGFSYVNIHPGMRAKVAIDSDKESFRVLRKPVRLETAHRQFLGAVAELSAFAKARQIVFTVETVPKRVAHDFRGLTRHDPLNIYELPVTSVIAAADSGIAVANDFGHTAATTISANTDRIWKNLYRNTVRLAARTRLIHLGFLTAPFNGTDFHDSLDNPLLNTDQAVPNRTQLVTLIGLFKNRDDVWIITEPKNNHVRNYFLAKKLLDEAAKAHGDITQK